MASTTSKSYLNDATVTYIDYGKTVSKGNISSGSNPSKGQSTLSPTDAAKMIDWGMIKNAPGLASETEDGFLSSELYVKILAMLSLKIVGEALIAKGEKGDSAYEVAKKYFNDQENIPTEEEWARLWIPVDDLETENSDRSLSANQGVILKGLIDKLQLSLSRLSEKIKETSSSNSEETQKVKDSLESDIKDLKADLEEKIEEVKAGAAIWED